MEKLQDCVSFGAKAEPHLSGPQNTEPVSPKSVEQIETETLLEETLLEELAELIESEGGILIP